MCLGHSSEESMNHLQLFALARRRDRLPRSPRLFCTLLGVLFAGPITGLTADTGSRVAVGKSASPSAMILRREQPGKPWQTVADKEALYSGDLLIGLPGATLRSNNGAVELSMRSNIDGGARYPVKESAVILQE